jgi:hypothetical protein
MRTVVGSEALGRGWNNVQKVCNGMEPASGLLA